MAGYLTRPQNFYSGYHPGPNLVCGGQLTPLLLRKGPQSLISAGLSVADHGRDAERPYEIPIANIRSHMDILPPAIMMIWLPHDFKNISAFD